MRTSHQNAFETTLTAEMPPTSLTATVASIGQLTSPCYLVIEPDNDDQREVILFDGTFGANSFTSTAQGNRYLPGSAEPNGLTHPVGAVVRSVPVTQELDDLHDRIDTIAHGDLAGLTAGDPHTQYLLESNFNKAQIDAMGINADQLNGQQADDFALDPHTHSELASSDHDHPNATSSTAGFMSAADKDNLDNMVASEGQPNQDIVAGDGLTGGGNGATVDIAHDDTSTASSQVGSGAEWIRRVDIDGFGHVTNLTKESVTPALIGAQPAFTLTDYVAKSEHNNQLGYIQLRRINPFGTSNGAESGIQWDNLDGGGGVPGFNWVPNQDYVPASSNGLYIVSFTAIFAANATGTRQAQLRVGGTAYSNIRAQQTMVSAGASMGSVLHLSWSGYLTTGLPIFPVVYQESGGGLNVTGVFTVARIGAF